MSQLIKQYLKKISGFTYTQRLINRGKNIRCRKKHVAMFHTGRCGSTVLANMLNAHTKITWAGEIFERHMGVHGKKPTPLIETINLSRNDSTSRVYGFETKYLPQQHLSDRCLNMNVEDYVAVLRELGFSHFIALHRKNYLRRAISAQVGRERGGWHSKEKTIVPKRVFISINSFKTGSQRESLLELFARMDESYERLRQCLPNKSLFLTYEDDIQNDPRIAYRRICDFLDEADETPEINFQRTNPFAYEQMVINLAEVKAVMKDTKYCWMLDS
jgi:hypothetical protein